MKCASVESVVCTVPYLLQRVDVQGVTIDTEGVCAYPSLFPFH